MTAPLHIRPDAPREMVLSEAEAAVLRTVVGHIIPASPELGVPGADDPAIFADIVRSIGRFEADVRESLRLIEAGAGGSFAGLDAPAQAAVLTAFRDAYPVLAIALGAVAARCYYRDDRVMRAVGMEVRAPYPQGYEVEPGDWSLLEPVRARGKIYRDVDKGRGP